jgi:hypothetical protein
MFAKKDEVAKIISVANERSERPGRSTAQPYLSSQQSSRNCSMGEKNGAMKLQ